MLRDRGRSASEIQAQVGKPGVHLSRASPEINLRGMHLEQDHAFSKDVVAMRCYGDSQRTGGINWRSTGLPIV